MEADQNNNQEDIADLSKRIDVLKHLSQIHRWQFDIRQKLEWRIVFTALAFYVAAAVTEIKLSLNPCWVTSIYVIFTSVILIYLWIIHKNHGISKHAAHVAENTLWDLAGKDHEKVFRKTFRWNWWYFIGQVIVLSIFAVSSFVIVKGNISTTEVQNEIKSKTQREEVKSQN